MYTCKTQYIKYIKGTRMRALFLFSQFATFRKTAHKKSDNLREITTKDTYNRYDSIFGNHFQDFVQKGTRKFRIKFREFPQWRGGTACSSTTATRHKVFIGHVLLNFSSQVNVPQWGKFAAKY